MRNRNLFLPRDVNGLSSEVEKERVWRLCCLWYLLDDAFIKFKNDHIKNDVEVEGAAPYEVFFKSFTRVLRNYKNSRMKDDLVFKYYVGSRLQIYEFLMEIFEEFMPVYEARFEANFYDKAFELAISCGQVCQMMQISIDGRLDQGEYYFRHNSALRRGGATKAAGSNKAKAFVQSEWATHQQAYQNNKSAFARDYSRRVKNELGTDVTEKTIREVWLIHTPSAAKQAGKLAVG